MQVVMESMKYILGSGSPRRRELLGMILPEFTVLPSRFDEESIQREEMTPCEIVCTLSREKAREVFERYRAENPQEEICVIGGDTIVISPDGEVMGKPSSRADAARMLRQLSGCTHQVMTAVTVMAQSVGQTLERVFPVQTDVTFYPLNDHEIERYLDTGEPFDKAGSYGIQGYGGLLVERIAGDYNNVVGLPVARLMRELREMGLLPES